MKMLSVQIAKATEFDARKKLTEWKKKKRKKNFIVITLTIWKSDCWNKLAWRESAYKKIEPWKRKYSNMRNGSKLPNYKEILWNMSKWHRSKINWEWKLNTDKDRPMKRAANIQTKAKINKISVESVFFLLFVSLGLDIKFTRINTIV